MGELEQAGEVVLSDYSAESVEKHNSIAVLDQATRMLAEIQNVDDAKQLIDLAEAARVYAKQVKLGLEAQNHAAEIKLRAQRRAGEILDGMEKAKGNAGTMAGRDSSGAFIMKAPEDNTPTYAEMDITYKDAHVWQHIARMPEEVFEEYLAVSKNDGKEITTAGVVRVARAVLSEQSVRNTPDLPASKYRVIYADPPWKYGNTMPDYMGVQDDHYPLMTIDEICALPIKDLAEDNAVLFLWVTSPILEEAFQVVKAWGFEYKASFVWDKVKHVMGHYNSVRHELLLVCTRGSCQPDVKRLFDSVYSEERTEHSRKPEYFRQIIDTIYLYGKKIELFSRMNIEGWDSYGNQLP